MLDSGKTITYEHIFEYPLKTSSDVVVEQLYLVERNNKWGYINSRGEEVIKCQYIKAEKFQDGLNGMAIVTVQDVKGSKVPQQWYIDRTGKLIRMHKSNLRQF